MHRKKIKTNVATTGIHACVYACNVEIYFIAFIVITHKFVRQ